jgi:hypothetical protein
MQRSCVQTLFFSAAIFNAIVAIPPFMFYEATTKFLRLELDSPPAILFYKISMAMVLWLAWSYWMVGRDPVKYRPYIIFGVGAKLIFIVLTVFPWNFSFIPLTTKVLMGIDSIYIILFINYYRRTLTSTT